MRTIVAASIAIALAGVMASPAAGQLPTQDSVTGSGVVLGGSNATFSFEIDVHAGPSGENPTGGVAFRSTTNASLFFEGPVTCLSVSGNVANLNVSTQQFGVVGLEVTDSPSGDLIRAIPNPTSSCGIIGTALDLPVISGDVVVVDAPALPTSIHQCKNGGWRHFAGFKNQGDCVSFIATRGMNQASG